jgi:hypothetical protein
VAAFPPPSPSAIAIRHRHRPSSVVGLPAGGFFQDGLMTDRQILFFLTEFVCPSSAVLSQQYRTGWRGTDEFCSFWLSLSVRQVQVPFRASNTVQVDDGQTNGRSDTSFFGGVAFPPKSQNTISHTKANDIAPTMAAATAAAAALRKPSDGLAPTILHPETALNT